MVYTYTKRFHYILLHLYQSNNGFIIHSVYITEEGAVQLLTIVLT